MTYNWKFVFLNLSHLFHSSPHSPLFWQSLVYSLYESVSVLLFVFIVFFCYMRPPSRVVQLTKNPPAIAGVTRDPGSIPGSGSSPGVGMATHSSVLAWKIPWTQSSERLRSVESQRVRHDWAHTHKWNSMVFAFFWLVSLSIIPSGPSMLSQMARVHSLWLLLLSRFSRIQLCATP